MSYINMDHAGWVQSQIGASKKQKMTKRDQRARADHKGWFAAPDDLTPFQRRAFDILGIIGNGIYNAPIAWDGVIWARDYLIVPWRKGLGTWDFMELTRLVFLCHEARIRGYIETHSPRHLAIALHERSHHGGMSKRHPNLDEAISGFRSEFGSHHSINYQMPPLAVAAE